MPSLIHGQARHEFSAYFGGGLSTLQYSTNIGDTKGNFGGSFGIGYAYFINNTVSLNSGIELSNYKTKYTIQSLSDKYLTNDGLEDFELQYQVTNYEEKQSAMYLNIPLMIQLQKGGDNKFYVAGGVKLGFPLSGEYKVGKTNINAVGYYPQYGENAIVDAPAFSGFGTFTTVPNTKDLDFKVAVLLSLETGIKWKISNKLSLYSGIYIDYGLNDIRKETVDKEFLIYNKNNPSNYTYNSALISQYSQSDQTKSLTEKVMPLALGVKIRLSYSK
jgi:hypothetical protein